MNTCYNGSYEVIGIKKLASPAANSTVFLYSGMGADETCVDETRKNLEGLMHGYSVIPVDSSYILRERDFVFKGISIPKGPLANPNFGVEIVDYKGCKIQVTTLERTFVDILHRPTLTGNWEEIWRSLESIEYLNLEQILVYIKLLDNVITCGRVAFFLDQHREMLGLSEKDLVAFDTFIPKSPHYLDRRNKEPNQLITRWNLIVPKSLLKRAWEEPHENF